MFRVFFILLLTLFTCQATAVSYEREFKQIESRYTRMVPHIIKLSDQFGISAELITATIYKESTFKSNAANPKSSARGLMQLTRPTAKAMIKKYGKQLVRPPCQHEAWGCVFARCPGSRRTQDQT